MNHLEIFFGYFNKINNLIGKIVSWFTLLMVLITVIIVVLRYGFNEGFIWMQESVRFMYAAVFLLCAAYTLIDDEHVRVDVFYLKMSLKYRSIVNCLGSLFFLLPVCITILFFSYDYVLNSWAQFEGSLEERGLHAVYILKTFIWGFAIMLIMQSLFIIVKSLNYILKVNKEILKVNKEK